MQTHILKDGFNLMTAEFDPVASFEQVTLLRVLDGLAA